MTINWETLYKQTKRQFDELFEITKKAEKSIDDLQAEVEKWRMEAFQKYPTPDAYDAACKALHKHRERADAAEAELERYKAALQWYADDSNYKLGPNCGLGAKAREALSQGDKSNQEDWKLEREFLLNHLRNLATKWPKSDRHDEKLSARHFHNIVDELESGELLQNAKLLVTLRDEHT